MLISPLLSELKNQIESCTICAQHLPFGPRPIVQVHEHARILIAGQAPGSKVHKTGIPFDDPSGVRLREWMGVDEATFYDASRIAILPMGFCFPGTGKSGDLPPRPECAEAWRQRVLDLLPDVQLTIVLGAYARNWHIKSHHKRLSDLVADWESFWPDVLPLPHPSPRNQRWFRNHAWFERDILPVLQNRVQELLK